MAKLPRKQIDITLATIGGVNLEQPGDLTLPLDALAESGASNGQVPVWDDATGKWVPGNAAQIGGLDAAVEYTNPTPTPSALGGIVAGTTFTNKPITALLTDLLYPYQAPAFSSFSIAGQAAILEVGDSILANRTFNWGTTNASNIQANSIAIRDVTGNADLASGLANDGTELLPNAAIQKTTATNHVFRISGVNSKSNTFSRDYTVAWQFRRYMGESSSELLNEESIKALRNGVLAASFAGDYSFNAGGYKYIAYPVSFGTATTFKDKSTNMDVLFDTPYIVSVTNSFGATTDYRVHRTVNIINAAFVVAVS